MSHNAKVHYLSRTTFDPNDSTVQAHVHVDAIAVIGGDTTDTPETVHQLGIQVGWLESGSVG